MNSLPPATPVAAPPSLGVKAEVDDCIRALMVLSDGAERQFLELVENVEVWLSERVAHNAEVSRLQADLMKSQADVTRLEKKLKNAQHLLGLEKEKRISSEHQIKQIFQMMEKLKSGASKGVEEPQEKLLSLLSSTLEHGGLQGVPSEVGYRISQGGLESIVSPRAPLSTIDESGDTLDAVSDIDLTEGDDLECSSVLLRSGHSYNKGRRSSPPLEGGRRSSSRKRASSPLLEDDGPLKQEGEQSGRRKQPRRSREQGQDAGTGRAGVPFTCTITTTTTSSSSAFQPSAPPLPPGDDWGLRRTPQGGRRQAPLPPTPQMSTPQSRYSTPPQSSPLLRHLSNSRVQNRPHCFYNKTIYMSELCQPCGKRIKFGRVALKCRDCRAVSHQECRDAVPVPCVPTASTPDNKHYIGSIADFTPNVSPMVPALVVHCTIEVENRGISEVGIYRVSALDRDVKELKEKFLRGKGLPNLSQLDIHTICCTVKNFLRGLKEPLITHTLWHQFVRAANTEEDADCEAALYQCIAELPQPNRDTLAWMLLHLQRVSEMKECLMSADNLARVFGPTVVGYSVSDPEPQMILVETSDQQNVMSKLLNISSDYWESFTHVTNDQLFSSSVNQAEGDPRMLDNCRGRTNSGTGNRRRSIVSHTPMK